MTDYSEYIDAYFNQDLSQEQVQRFEQQLASDQNFAEEVAFYLSTKQALKQQLSIEKKERFKLLVQEEQAPSAMGTLQARTRKLWIYRAVAAAAIVILMVSAWYLFYTKPVSGHQRAETYIQANFSNLPVTMGVSLDSVGEGLRLYNEGHFDASLKIFENISEKDNSNYSVKKYLGIIYLRLGNCDKALQYFQQLKSYSLYSNPAVFYEALTLMKRNQPGDKLKAKQLLQEVSDKNLEGKETALKWLKNW